MELRDLPSVDRLLADEVLAAARAPSRSTARTGSALMSWTTSWNPFRQRFEAIGRPMFPSPTKPTVITTAPVVVRHVRRLEPSTDPKADMKFMKDVKNMKKRF